MGRHKYTNDEISVFWDSEVCIHSEVCVKNLGKVFNTKNKPWVNVNAGTVEEITTLIDSCPSGALSYEHVNQKEPVNKEKNMASDQVKVTISENGPYLIKGNFSVEDSAGNKVETKETAALCRCGHSANKPFCDGTHRKVDFKG